MKTIQGEIKLGSKTYTATEIDYDGYKKESGSITLGEKEHGAVKVVEDEEGD